MGPLGQPQRGVRAATGNAADMWGGAVSEAQRALASARAAPRGLSGKLGRGAVERGRELGRVRGRKRAGRGLGLRGRGDALGRAAQKGWAGWGLAVWAGLSWWASWDWVWVFLLLSFSISNQTQT